MYNRYLDQPWKAPLFPIAVAVTLGIVADRLLSLPFFFVLMLMVVSLFAWLAAWSSNLSGSSLVWLWIALFAVGAMNHQRNRQPESTCTLHGMVTQKPKLVKVRGIVNDEPVIHAPSPNQESLRSFPELGRTDFILSVDKISDGSGWTNVSGRVRVFIPEIVRYVHAGDRLQVIGSMSTPSPPNNPGEFDFRAMSKDRGVTAVLSMQQSEGAVVLVERGSPWSIGTPFRYIRSWAETRIDQMIPKDRQQLAKALLLGRQEALDQQQWDRFQRTGVVHVLAISGQHLMVLAGFLAILFRLLPLSRRTIAVLIPLILLGYAILTGWRPPVRRAFFMVSAYCGAAWFRRIALPANALALAWLILCLFNPTAIFYAGCQLSFLAVIVLIWGTSLLYEQTYNPLDQQTEQVESLWWKLVKNAGRKLIILYLASWAVWLALSPMIAARFHLVCPSALLLGVPVLLLTSVALIAGFLMFAASSVFPLLAAPFAWLTDRALSACDGLVRAAEQIPGAYWYVPDVPQWWLAAFYIALLAGLFLPFLRRNRVWVGMALAAWLCIGLSLDYFQPKPEQLRCTFLAVGHGTCVVLESPDGRTLLYDAGAITGPQVTRQQIAPYLWSRGIRRIDEVYLSHADLDHFNGLSALFDRFAIGQISCTPSFAQRQIEAVKFTLQRMKQHVVPIRTLRAGDRLQIGDVQIKVLHPPAAGPAGPENVRSLVLLIQHYENAILLTGDLEKTGLEQLLELPPVPVDVLMAPHHGSHSANTKELAEWTQPKIVISTQGKPRSYSKWDNPYTKMGARYLTTWKQGAVTVISDNGRLVIETFLDRQRWVLDSKN